PRPPPTHHSRRRLHIRPLPHPPPSPHPPRPPLSLHAALPSYPTRRLRRGLDHRDLHHQLHRQPQLCPERWRWHQDPLHLVQGRRRQRLHHRRGLHPPGPDRPQQWQRSGPPGQQPGHRELVGLHRCRQRPGHHQPLQALLQHHRLPSSEERRVGKVSKSDRLHPLWPHKWHHLLLSSVRNGQCRQYVSSHHRQRAGVAHRTNH